MNSSSKIFFTSFGGKDSGCRAGEIVGGGRAMVDNVMSAKIPVVGAWVTGGVEAENIGTPDKADVGGTMPRPAE